MNSGIKVIIVEDELLVAEDISSDLTDFGCSVVGVFDNGEECIDKIELLNPDLVIMDIRIKGKYDGIETAKIINRFKRFPIIYLSANSDRQTLSKVISIFPSLFISKPYNKTDLFLAVSLFNQYKKEQVCNDQKSIDDAIFVKVGTVNKKVLFNDILFIEGCGSYAKIVTKNESILSSHNLNYVQLNLQNNNFKRVHRSYVVNIENVDGFEQTNLIIGSMKIPISRQYVKETLRVFNKL